MGGPPLPNDYETVMVKSEPNELKRIVTLEITTKMSEEDVEWANTLIDDLELAYKHLHYDYQNLKNEYNTLRERVIELQTALETATGNPEIPKELKTSKTEQLQKELTYQFIIHEDKWNNYYHWLENGEEMFLKKYEMTNDSQMLIQAKTFSNEHHDFKKYLKDHTEE